MRGKRSEQVDATVAPLIVGVGASAGGQDAIIELLEHLGPFDQFAIVLVQHTDPSSVPLESDLVRSATEAKVIEVTKRTKLKPGCVYIAPASELLEIKNGAARIVASDADESFQTAVDYFFHSLAEDQGDHAVGIVLSGAGSDGTVGLKAISDASGLTFAQDAASAKFDSMPRSAATTGAADHVCRPAEIAVELLRYAKHVTDFGGDDMVVRVQKQIGEAIPRIAELLLKVTGHNFQHYKITTLMRRIQRRMQVLKIATASDYLAELQNNEDEANRLFRELLIGVTAFFRDPEAFDAIATTVLPSLFQGKGANDVVRIWVAGCSTGEEAYTIAMLCREHAQSMTDAPEVQIFATDIDERALQIARNGSYPTGITEHISAERLKRFFVKRGKRFQVTKEIRDRVLFSKHNLISDPPFSRQDMISCRNMLIYLGSHLQEKLIPLFHYALRPGGFLFLGPSETISSHGELFRALDNKFRISQRKGAATESTQSLAFRGNETNPIRMGVNEPDTTVDLDSIRQRILLDEFAPKAVVIDQSGQVLNASDGVSKYLSVSGGDFHNNIIKMAVPGLRIGLRAAINEATKTRRKTTHDKLSIRDEECIQRVMLTVQPMPQLGADNELFLVVFHDIGEPIIRDDSDDMPESASTGDQNADAIIAQMERELETMRADLERTLQDMEAANEELKSSNEELLSMNEELQSANEELETSKDEIRAGSDAVARVNADLENLLRSTKIATVFLDKDLNIRSFTPSIADIYSLIPTDVGRPLQRFVPHVQQMPPLPDPQKIQNGETVDDTILADSGKSYIRRVLPYRSHTGVCEGIVVTFVDVSQVKESQELFQLLVDASSQIVWITNAAGVAAEDSPSWRAFTGQSKEDWLGFGWLNVVHPDDRERTIAEWKSVVEQGKTLSVEYRLRHRSGRYRWMHVHAVAQRFADGTIRRWIGMNTDIDDRKQAEAELFNAKSRLELSLEVSDVAPWSLDAETYHLASNPTLNRLYGFEDDATPSLDQFVKRMDETARDRVAAAIDHAIQTGETYDQEYPIRWPSGEIRHVRARGQVRLSTHDQTKEFFGVVVDITERKRREIDITEREAHLRRVINNQLGLVGMIDRDGILLDVDDRSLEIAQTGREEVLGKHFADAPWWNYDPTVANQMRDAMRQALSGEVVRFDVSLFSHGADGVLIDFMIAPVFDDDGEVEYLIPSGVDIRDRKMLEQRHKDTATRLEAIFNTAVDGIITIDRDGRINSANRAASKLFGYGVHELVGNNVNLLMPEPDHSNHHDYLTKYEQTGDRHIIGNQRQVTGRRKDGSTFPLDLSVSETTLHGEHRFVGIVRDITDRVQAEQAIQDASRRMEMALRAGGMAAWEWTPLKSYWTRELYELLGITSDQTASSELFFSFVHPDDLDELRRVWQEAIDGTTPYEAEFRVIRADGQTRWMMGQGEVVRDASGNVVRLYGLNWDSTNEHLQAKILRESEQRAKDANESKSAFLANMSHEIRTPMTAVLGYVDLLTENVTGTEALQHIQTIRRNGNFLLEIINDILDLSKIEAGKFDVQKESFSLPRLIEDVRSIMSVRATEKDLTLEIKYQNRIPAAIQSDPKRLKQVLVNLLGNAIKFTESGEVKLEVRYQQGRDTDDPQLHFDVIDTGIGISDDHLSKLFQPFSQADASVSRKFGGTGLGLAISRRLAEVLGGSIQVQSQPGKGSRFSLCIDPGHADDIPLIEPSLVLEPTEPSVTETPIDLHCHALIVDDRRDVRFLSKHILTRAGATVEEAEDGQQAVDRIREHFATGQLPDIVLLDMQMPKLDGYQTATQLRQLGYTGPIVALTADAMQGDMSRCIEAGCNDYLSKPIDKAKMLRMISEMISNPPAN
ncbi:Autoinducer 2 sensor kinase/phosphatase LuxQ [Rubripirellula lacrimiformis]|uniref:Sensor protein FixL n=1 Tax=Rubripirellula lacrimiformis TaxID=1930273 RepID=A0A517N4X8_9BACT|nr:PAS domain S-box protein [Rubripirellula lacrimiformis]QDT02068.1 Autoinducer 2 sensor kinase/phosphatase LuxQ [Rubripirellula lacrimiformis]